MILAASGVSYQEVYGAGGVFVSRVHKACLILTATGVRWVFVDDVGTPSFYMTVTETRQVVLAVERRRRPTSA